MSAPDDRSAIYTDAFYQAVLDRWMGTLGEVADRLAQDAALRTQLEATDVEFALRQQLLERVLPQDVDTPVRNLLYALMQRGDLGLLSEISSSIMHRASRADAVRIPVDVVSAVPLADEERKMLLTRLEVQFGAGLEVRYRVDPAILGGVIVRAGDRLIDGSVASRLAVLKQTLGVAAG